MYILFLGIFYKNFAPNNKTNINPFVHLIRMVYLQFKKIKEKEYLYLVKNIRLSSSKWKKINKYLGNSSFKGNLSREYLENKDFFVNEEFNLRMKSLSSNSLTRDPAALSFILKSSIEVENLKEIDPVFRDSIVRDFLREFFYNSNNIEGSKIPKEEIDKILDHKKSLHKNRMEIKEVENSLAAWYHLENDFTFSTGNINKLYRILTDGLRTSSGNEFPRGYKKINNIVGNMKTTSFEEIPDSMRLLVEWYRANKKKMNSLELAFEFHLKFERIHPFDDANGRTGRMLMNKILIDAGFSPMIIFTKNRTSYFNAIASTVETGHSMKYTTFMVDQYKKTFKEFYLSRIRERN